MKLESEALMWLRVEGEKAPFSASGKYPIIAGYEHGNIPSYVAAARVGHIYHFTTIVEGATFVIYRDSVGIVQRAETFFVLALRGGWGNSSLDFSLKWLEFWPTRDPNYSPVSDSARRDDEILSSLLNSLRNPKDSEYLSYS